MLRSVFLLAVMVLTALAGQGFAAEAPARKDPYQAQISAYFRLPHGVNLGPQQKSQYRAFQATMETNLREALSLARKSKQHQGDWATAMRHLQLIREEIRRTQDQLVASQTAPTWQTPMMPPVGRSWTPAVDYDADDSDEVLVVPVRPGVIPRPVPKPWPPKPQPPTHGHPNHIPIDPIDIRPQHIAATTSHESSSSSRAESFEQRKHK